MTTAKMTCADASFMTTPVNRPPSTAAVAAFLRGTYQRARLLATVQAGAGKPAQQALAVVAQVFATEAGQWPIAQWPQQYWRLLLATPHLHQPGVSEPALPLPGIARLPPTQRAAFLLQLVAELDDATAATALGISVGTYQDTIRNGLPRDALGQPDVDVWRAWRAAVHRELTNAEPTPAIVLSASSSRTANNVAKKASANAVAAGAAPHHHVRWLWWGVAVCVLAFTTTFFLHPAGRAVLQGWTATIKVKPLPAADAPKSLFDAGDVALHPDRDLLAAPEEAGHASRLAWLAWLAVNSADPSAENAVQLPVMAATASRTAMDPARDASALLARLQQWDALPARVRGMRRGQWQAWRALTSPERVQLRGIAQRLHMMDPQQQHALRERFLAQPSDARNGWWLGPALGRDWPSIQALFAYVDADQRDALLQLLRTTDRDGREVLARLAQTTSPEDRARLRTELLGQAPSQRGAWLRAELQR